MTVRQVKDVSRRLFYGVPSRAEELFYEIEDFVQEKFGVTISNLFMSRKKKIDQARSRAWEISEAGYLLIDYYHEKNGWHRLTVVASGYRGLSRTLDFNATIHFRGQWKKVPKLSEARLIKLEWAGSLIEGGNPTNPADYLRIASTR